MAQLYCTRVVVVFRSASVERAFSRRRLAPLFTERRRNHAVLGQIECGITTGVGTEVVVPVSVINLLDSLLAGVNE